MAFPGFFMRGAILLLDPVNAIPGHSARKKYFLVSGKTALAVAGYSSYDPAASNRPRRTHLFYQLIYASFLSRWVTVA